MSRQSSRLLAKHEAQIQSGSNPSAVAATMKVAPAHPGKKQKMVDSSSKSIISQPREVDYRKIRGKRGMLKNITEMPLDILMEILGQLQPIDLLHISRASKDLRAIVTASNASFLWKKAYSNIPDSPPPSCPPGTSFLHYTNLVYGRNCHFCASTRANIVHYGSRVRLCNGCAQEHLIHVIYYDSKYDLCVGTYMRKCGILRSGSYILKEAFERHEQALELLKGREADVEFYKKKWRFQNAEASEFAARLQSWDHGRRSKGHVVFEEVRKRRRDAIVSKLTALGYGEDIRTSHIRLERLPGVLITKELTDRSWENIKNKIVAAYEYMRQETVKKDMINKFRQRTWLFAQMIRNVDKDLPKPLVTPPNSYIALSEPFCDIIKTYGPDVNENTIKAQIQTLEHRIPELAREWISEANKVLLDLVSPRGMQASANTDRETQDMATLQLATTFFRCHWCAEALSYPRVLMHSCIRTRIFPDPDDDERAENEATAGNEHDESNDDDEEDEYDEKEEENNVSDETYGIPRTTVESVWAKMQCWIGSTWNEGNDQLTVDEEATHFAEAIVRACGEDPSTLTSAQMEDLDVRVECTRCGAGAKKTQKRLVMTYKMAILHDMECHFEDPPTADGWKLVTDEADRVKVRGLEEKTLKRSKSPYWRCRHCVASFNTWAIKSHLSDGHGIKEDDEKALKEHVYAYLDAPMKSAPLPVKI